VTCHPHHHSLFIMMQPLAPTIHPASSGSQGWGQVLGGCSFVPPSPPLPVVTPWCGDMAISTHDPPHEQWLTGLGAGAGLSFVVWRLWHCVHVHVSLSPSPSPSPSPPCKQLLTAVGRGCCGGHGGPHSHLAAPLSTPRAVAHGSGWGCCGGGHHHRHGGQPPLLSSLPILPLMVVIWPALPCPVAPAIHPTSRGSWAWCRGCCSIVVWHSRMHPHPPLPSPHRAVLW
jgi:hypothetical protein